MSSVKLDEANSIISISRSLRMWVYFALWEMLKWPTGAGQLRVGQQRRCWPTTTRPSQGCVLPYPSLSDFSWPQMGVASSQVEQSQLLPPLGSQENTTPPWAMLLRVQSSGTGQSVAQLSGYNSGVSFWQVSFIRCGLSVVV